MASAWLGVIADIQNRPACRGVCAMQSVDTRAERQNRIKQTQIMQNGQAGWLEDQPGADRLGLVKALEDSNPVAGTAKIERSRQAGRPSAGNRNVERLQAELPATV